MARVQFLLQTLRRYAQLQDRSCPYCGSARTTGLGRKKLVLQLRRCERCALMFRYPKDDASASLEFYQDDYEEGAVTALPSDAELARLLSTAFRGSTHDFAAKLKVLRRVKPSGRVLDYGASWGYGAWQLTRAGYDATAFEISKPRARYGREMLGVPMLDDPGMLEKVPDGSFDGVFANHVLEHLPRPARPLREIRRVLAPRGVLLAFVPNCAACEAPRVFVHKKSFALGEKHPLALDDRFFLRSLPALGFEVRAFGGVTAVPDRPFDTPPTPVSPEPAELVVLARVRAEPPPLASSVSTSTS